MIRRRTIGNFVGLSIIVIGAIIGLVIYNTYDTTELDEAKSWTSTTIEEDSYIETLKTERVYVTIAAVLVFFMSIVVGSILYVLGNIEGNLEVIAFKEKGDIDAR